MRIYFDTEFTSADLATDPDLISAGFVAANGREWYIEISDFSRFECSSFVREVVLPLLDAPLSQKKPRAMFSLALCDWLSSFSEDIELVSDHPCDWKLINRCCREDFIELPFEIRWRIWHRPDEFALLKVLDEAEAAFWQLHPGRQHHALFDARRLSVIVEHVRELGYEGG